MLKIHTAPTRTCKRCNVEQGKDCYMPTGNICFTCGKAAKETQPERHAKANRKWYVSYTTRIKAQRACYKGE